LEDKQILVSQALAKIVEIWRKRNRRFGAKEISLASGLLRHFGKIVLSPVHAKETVAVVAYACGVKLGANQALAPLAFVSVLISIFFGSADSLRGAVTSRTPSLYSAVSLEVSTPSGST